MKKRTVKLSAAHDVFVKCTMMTPYVKRAWGYHLDCLRMMPPDDLVKAHDIYALLIAERDMPLRAQ